MKDSKKTSVICLIILVFIMCGCKLNKIDRHFKNQKYTYNQDKSKFNFIDNKILIKTQIGGTLPVDMLLDLGAGTSIIFMDTIFQKLIPNQESIPLPGKMVSADGKKTHKYASFFGNISTPLFNITNSFIIIKQRQNILSCNPYQGLWGTEKFVSGSFNTKESKILFICMQDTTITIMDTLPDLVDWMQTETNFKGISSVFYLKMNSGSKSFYFLFDTGYSGSIIMKEKDFSNVKQNSNSITDAKKAYGLVARTLTSDIYDTVFACKSNISITNSPLIVHSVPISMMKSINRNIIGMDFIKRFNIIVDYQNKNIYLQPNENYKPEESSFFRDKGLTVTKSIDNSFKIQAIVCILE